MIILSVVLNRRYVGQSVIDTFGLRDRGFSTHCVRTPGGDGTRNVLLKSLIALSLRQHHPNVVLVVRIIDPRARSCIGMQGSMLEMLRRKNIPYILRTTCDARTFFFNRYRQKRRDEIGRLLTSAFFPELRGEVYRSGDGERYWRQSWWSLALAVIELTEHHPYAITSLLEPRERMPPNLSSLVSERLQEKRDNADASQVVQNSSSPHGCLRAH